MNPVEGRKDAQRAGRPERDDGHDEDEGEGEARGRAGAREGRSRARDARLIAPARTMAAEAAKIAGALVLGHAANVFASYWIHRAQHSGLARGWLRAIHERAHHPAPGTEPSAGERAAGHLAWAGGVAATAALYLAALPGWMAWLWIAEGAALAGAVYWLHREYDQPQSELERFGWFRRCRSWHRHHHAERSDSNYSVGGPLLGLAPDRVLGTFADTGER